MKKNRGVQNLDRRLALIEGQVAGIRKMLVDGRDCFEITQQIAAVRSALARIGVEVLKDESITCVRRKDLKDLEKILDTLFKLS